MQRPALFVDRDGVIIRDVHLMVNPDDIEVLPGAAAAIAKAQHAGFATVVVTNQSVIARGLCTERHLHDLHRRIDELLVANGCRPLDGYYYCPHHPEATVAAYRQTCQCRKPGPGLLLAAAADLHLDLPRSAVIGDRLTDVLAGHRAGCAHTVLVRSPATDAPLFSHVDAADLVEPDLRCNSLAEAVDWALVQPRWQDHPR